MSLATHLSRHDSQTLSLLFDPEYSPSKANIPISPSAPPDPHYRTSTLESIQKDEVWAVSRAESEPEVAFSQLSEILSSYPRYASAYNNRAQTRRILRHPRSEILSDLSSAIEHALPGNHMGPVSETQARVLRNAYAQRGAVLIEAGDEEKALEDFSLAARYGSATAQEALVKMNPYAKLCGAVVKGVMRKEIAGEVW